MSRIRGVRVSRSCPLHLSAAAVLRRRSVLFAFESFNMRPTARSVMIIIIVAAIPQTVFVLIKSRVYRKRRNSKPGLRGKGEGGEKRVSLGHPNAITGFRRIPLHLKARETRGDARSTAHRRTHNNNNDDTSVTLQYMYIKIPFLAYTLLLLLLLLRCTFVRLGRFNVSRNVVYSRVK